MKLYGYRLPAMSSLLLWGLLWEIIGRAGLSFFVPPLSEVLVTLYTIIGTPAFQKALGETAYAFSVGVISAIVIGIPTGILEKQGRLTVEEYRRIQEHTLIGERILAPLLQRLPRLKVVLEHITTRQAAEFVTAAPANVGATVTVHHLLYNRNAMFQGGIRPHYYCLPVLKRETHREALISAATSGNPKFFLGTDSAPHATSAKETACGCAGIYTAHAAIELYAEAFESAGALDKLEAFSSHFGPDFYGLPRNSDTLTLVKESHTLPGGHPGGITPLRAGEQLMWRLA